MLHGLPLASVSGSLQIFFIRHGQSTANAEVVWQGRLDFPPSELGKEQARLCGLALSEFGGFSGVYASPLRRASRTAGIIHRELKAAGRFEGEAIELDGLTERHGGLLQGRPWAQTVEEQPELIEKFRSLPEEEAWPLVGAETDEDLMSRFGEAVAEIRDRHAGDREERVVLVAHGGVLRAFLKSAFGEEMLPGTRRAPNASITRIRWNSEGEPELLDLASTTHLDDLPV